MASLWQRWITYALILLMGFTSVPVYAYLGAGTNVTPPKAELGIDLYTFDTALGEQYDADLGMYFLRARYMDPNKGRFHSLDTFEGRRTDPLSLHKYLYAHANPVSFIDPSGERGQMLDMAIAMSIRVMAFATRWNTFAFTSGGLTLSRYFQALGRFSERVVNITLSSYRNIQIFANTRIDHLFRIGDRVIAIETKYSAARKGSEQFDRLIRQINHMASSPQVTEVYVYFTRHPSTHQLNNIRSATQSQFRVIVGPEALDKVLIAAGAK